MKDLPRPDIHPDMAGARSADELFRAWAPQIARVLARLGVPPRDLDDAVQEVFLTAHRRGGYTPGPATERTWLCEIALRVASNARRRRRRKPDGEHDLHLDQAPARSTDPQESLELRQRLERVASAIERIPGEARLTFVLSELEGAAAEEVARAQGVAVGTVYSRLHAARRAFRAAYAELEVEPPPSLLTRVRARLSLIGSPTDAHPHVAAPLIGRSSR